MVQLGASDSVAHEVAVETSTSAPSSEHLKLDWGWWVFFQSRSHLAVGRPQYPLHMSLFIGLVECPHSSKWLSSDGEKG